MEGVILGRLVLGNNRMHRIGPINTLQYPTLPSCQHTVSYALPGWEVRCVVSLYFYRRVEGSDRPHPNVGVGPTMWLMSSHGEIPDWANYEEPRGHVEKMLACPRPSCLGVSSNENRIIGTPNMRPWPGH